MTISFRPATREKVNLLIGLAGGTGSGKTMSACKIAQGISGRDKPFAFIDTEQGRGRHYAPPPGVEPDFIETFRFDHAELHPPFRPDAYAEAILAADAAGYPVIVVDSASHEHAGEGGLLDWHEEELNRMAGSDWQKRERVKMAAWIAPKSSHKRFVSKLLQIRAHLVLCFRAEEKIEIIREGGQTKIVPKKSTVGLDGWLPVSEKNLPYELTASFLLTADKPGLPKPIKLQAQHRPLFPLDQPITEESGRALAKWAAGGAAAPAVQSSGGPSTGSVGAFITDDQRANLETLCTDNDIPLADLRDAADVDALSKIPARRYKSALNWINERIAEKSTA